MADDAEIRRLITSTQVVTEKLSHVSHSRTMPDLVNRFKVCTATRVVTEKLSHVSQSRTMPDLVNRFKVHQLRL